MGYDTTVEPAPVPESSRPAPRRGVSGKLVVLGIFLLIVAYQLFIRIFYRPV